MLRKMQLAIRYSGKWLRDGGYYPIVTKYYAKKFNVDVDELRKALVSCRKNVKAKRQKELELKKKKALMLIYFFDKEV